RRTRRKRWSNSSPRPPPRRSSANTASRRRSDKNEERIIQRLLQESATEVPRLGTADGGSKGVGGESAAGRPRRRAEKGHRPRHEAGCGEKKRNRDRAQVLGRLTSLRRRIAPDPRRLVAQHADHEEVDFRWRHVAALDPDGER